MLSAGLCLCCTLHSTYQNDVLCLRLVLFVSTVLIRTPSRHHVGGFKYNKGTRQNGHKYSNIRRLRRTASQATWLRGFTKAFDYYRGLTCLTPAGCMCGQVDLACHEIIPPGTGEGVSASTTSPAFSSEHSCREGFFAISVKSLCRSCTHKRGYNSPGERSQATSRYGPEQSTKVHGRDGLYGCNTCPLRA